MSIKYLDFDLLIERIQERYRARVLESPAGEASIEFKVPFSQAEIDDFFTQIGQTRSFETQQIRKIHDFGQALFEAVFSGPVRDRLRASLGEANLQSAGLRIRLRLMDTPELGNLPWEFIYDPGLNRFLALSVNTPLVRYLETSQLSQAFAVQPPLRILAMICGPKDFPRLDVEREWENLQGSLQELQSRYLVDLQRLYPPTLSALQQQLRRDQYHIFHFIGHGTFSRADQDGFLLLENEQRGGHRLSGRDLGTILHDHRPLRLAVLNACEGARTALDDQFAGTAQSLVQQGIPAVIAMQFRITDQASITLAHEFYGALADGYPVDAALTEARKAIKTEGNDLEWGTPVLYMRSPDGHIFDIAPLPRSVRPSASIRGQDPEKAARIDRLYTEGLEAFYLGQWERAQEKFQAIIDSDPDHKDAAGKLETVRHKMHVESLNNQAVSAEKSGDWDKALEALKQLGDVEPGYPELTARIAKIRRQAQLGRLYTEAQQLTQAAKWQAVLGIFQEMDRLDPHFPDPDGLRSRSEQSLAKIKREADLESTYARALRFLDSGDWGAAARELRRVRQLEAGYRESNQLLRRAESELERTRTERGRRAASAINVPGLNPSQWILILFLTLMVGGLFEVNLDLPGVILDGLLLGLALWWFLNNAAGKLDWKEILILLAVPTMGQSLLIGIGSKYAHSWLAWTLLYAGIGAMIGAAIALIFLRKKSTLSRQRFVLIVAAWCLGYMLPAILYNTNYQSDAVWVFILPVVVTFISGGITLTVLEADVSRQLDWRSMPASVTRFFSLADGRVESLAIGFFGLAILGRLLAQLAGNSIGTLLQAGRLPALISTPIWMISAGLFIGLAIWWFLVKAAGRLDRKQVALILGLSIISQTAIVETGIFFKLGSLWHWCLLWGAYGVVIGFPIALITLKKHAIFNRKRLALIVSGWFLAYVLAVFISASLRGYHIGIFRQLDEGSVIAIVEQGVGVFIGGWITLSQLRFGAGRGINWLTVIAAAIGLYLGNPFSNFLVGKPLFYLDWRLQLLIWGFVFGATLAFPSRNYRRYLVFGLAAAFGMILGQYTAISVGAIGVIQRLIFGAFLGLSLGILTGKGSGLLSLSLISALAFVLRVALTNSVQGLAQSSSLINPFAFPLTLGVAGAVIAVGWCLLKPDETVPAVSQEH